MQSQRVPLPVGSERSSAPDGCPPRGSERLSGGAVGLPVSASNSDAARRVGGAAGDAQDWRGDWPHRKYQHRALHLQHTLQNGHQQRPTKEGVSATERPFDYATMVHAAGKLLKTTSRRQARALSQNG
eukprot:CAMPEP_0203841536 /NCGR_PEP_ID=MMETSP0359-20131031/1445_1 /ASSEMBLY_ACC=CAM_ASM_000338 /TAXON_ID=268821 /ORGANISM="Scrippsiella Hangoei, Strain SHTV-5" /LENGTH=127 /DNA_ID=CAMNT_0050755959 /DNA_START=316 /DNA_END=697 /DNA_ORIENTATION=+